MRISDWSSDVCSSYLHLIKNDSFVDRQALQKRFIKDHHRTHRLNLLIHDSGLRYICGNPINCATGPVLVTASQIGGGGGSENSEDRGERGRKDKRPAGYATVCGGLSITYAQGIPSRRPPLPIL